MLDILHSFHFTAQAMLDTAKLYIFWPQINNDVRQKYADCRLCQELRRAHATSTPMEEATTHIKPMDSLVADWCSCGNLHFLIFPDRCTGYIWA